MKGRITSGTKDKMYSFIPLVPLGRLLLLVGLCLVNCQPLEMETECPLLFSGEWHVKEFLKNCTPPKIYHCLSTENSGSREICMVPSIIPAGHQMVFDLKTSLPKIEKCPSDRFEPSNRWSNVTVPFCKYVRSECNGQGELEYWPGDETSDRICRCDYKQDYVESSFTERASVGFSKAHTDVQCYNFHCNGTRLQNYSCVEKCPEGMHYPNDSGHCQAFEKDINSKSPTITSTLKSTTRASNTPIDRTSSTLSPTNRDDSEHLTVKILVPICFILFLCLGIIIFLCWKRSHPKTGKQDNPEVIAKTEQKLHQLTDYIGNWWNLAKKLCLTDAEIDRIRADYSTSKEQCYNVLRTWKKKNTKAGWVKKLLQACQDAGVDHMDEVEAIFKEDAPLMTAANGNIQEYSV